MAEVTVNMIQKYLKKHGWQKFEAQQESGEKEGLVLTGWESPISTEPNVLVIDPMVEKHLVHFFVPEMASAPIDRTPSNRLQELLLAIGALNYRLLLGKFAYDPSDGEVRFSVVVPTDQSTFTYEQFEHCLEVIVMSVDLYLPIIKKIIGGELDHEAVMGNPGDVFLRGRGLR